MASAKEDSKSKRPGRTLKSTVIEPFKQIRLGVYVLIMSFAFLFAAAALIGFAFYQQYVHVMEIFSVVDPSAKWELVTNDIFYANAIKLLVLSLIYVVSMMYVVFRMTHRIYGPLVGIERFVEQMSQGDYSRRLGIRKNDDLQRLVMKLNEMAQIFEKKHGSTSPSGSKPNVPTADKSSKANVIKFEPK